MKRFFAAFAAALAVAALAVPAGAQVTVTVGGSGGLLRIGETVRFDSEGIGDRESRALFLEFDPGGSRFVTVSSIVIRGSNEFSFQLDPGDRLPLRIAGEFEYELQVAYQPTTPGPAEALLEITVQRVTGDDLDPEISVYSVNLIGRVPAYSLSYVLGAAGRRPVASGGTIDFGNKPVQQTTEATLVLANIGSRRGTVQAVQISGGPAFSLVDAPSFPVFLDAGEELAMQLGMTPPTTFEYREQMAIDVGTSSLRYDLVGVGGDLLQFQLTTFVSGTAVGPNRVQSGTSIEFGGGLTLAEITGRNTRAFVQVFDDIRVTGPFRLVQAPNLPVTVRPGESITVRVESAVTQPGSNQGVLAIGDALFDLSVEIPDLPAFSFSESGRGVGAAEQIPLSLSLESTYPTDIVGFMTLRFETRAFVDDPAIQWAAGGRQAGFTILAGTRQALFTGETNETAFQTGTVAGDIVVTAQFFAVDDLSQFSSLMEIQARAVEITPATVTELRFGVSEAAPVLRSAVLGNTGQGRFSVMVTGYSTARSVDSISFSFSGSSGANLTSPNLDADVAENFRTYYSGNQSSAFGSLFTATVDFVLDEGVFEDLVSVSVTAANGRGMSNSVSLPLN